MEEDGIGGDVLVKSCSEAAGDVKAVLTSDVDPQDRERVEKENISSSSSDLHVEVEWEVGTELLDVSVRDSGVTDALSTGVGSGRERGVGVLGGV